MARKRTKPAKPARKHPKNKAAKAKPKTTIRKAIAKPDRKKPVPKPVKQAKQEFMSSFEVQDGSKLETDIDKLYNTIREEGVVRLDKLAKKLGFQEEQVRDWADVLEEHNMIDIDYPVIGEPMLRIKKPKVNGKEWKSIEEKVREIDRHHRKPIPKATLIPLALIGGGAAAIYMTGLKYTILDIAVTSLNQNTQIAEFLGNLPFRDALFQNMTHIVFSMYVVLVLIIFLIIRFIRGRKKK